MRIFRNDYAKVYAAAIVCMAVFSLLLLSQTLHSTYDTWSLARSKSKGDIEIKFQLPEDISDRLDHLSIFRSPDPEQLGIHVSDIPSNTTQFTDSGEHLEDGTTYFYTVEAVDSRGELLPEGKITLQAVSDATPPVPPVVDPLPEYYCGLDIRVCWSHPDADNVADYSARMYNRTDTVTVDWTDQTCFLFKHVIEGAWYCFQARARDEAGNESEWSGVVCTITDNTPPETTSVNAMPLKGGLIELCWNQVGDEISGVSSYTLLRSESDDFSGAVPILTIEGGAPANMFCFEKPGYGYMDDTLENIALQISQRYCYRVVIKDRACFISQSDSVCAWSDPTSPPCPFFDPEPPYSPGESNTLYWTCDEPAQFYVEMDTDEDFEPPPNSISGWIDDTQWTFHNLTGGFTYYYRIMARDSLGNETGWCEIVYSTQDNSLPEPVTLLTVTMLENCDVKLCWGPVLDQVNGAAMDSLFNPENYIIYRLPYQDLDDTIHPDTLYRQGNMLCYIDEWENLEERNAYLYEVHPVDNAGNEQIEGNEKEWIKACWNIEPIIVDPLPPCSPGTCRDITWSPVRDAVEYQVQCGRGDCDCQFDDIVKTSTVPSTRETLCQLEHNGTYCYRVRALFKNNIRGNWSDTICSLQDAVPPDPVTDLEVTLPCGNGDNNGDIHLCWNRVDDNGCAGLCEYRIYRWSNQGEDPILLGVNGPDDTCYVDGWKSSLQYGREYCYSVHPVDCVGNEQTEGNIEACEVERKAPTLYTPVGYGGAIDFCHQGDFIKVDWNGSAIGFEYEAICCTTLQMLTEEPPCDCGIMSISPDSECSVKKMGWTPVTQWTFPMPDSFNQTFYFWVRKRDMFGNVSCWSNVDSFTVRRKTPTVDPLPDCMTANCVNLKWSQVYDALAYEVTCFTDSDFEPPTNCDRVVPNPYTTMCGFGQGVFGEYCFRVRAIFDIDTCDWSEEECTRIDNAPPESMDDLVAELPCGNDDRNGDVHLCWESAEDFGCADSVYYEPIAWSGDDSITFCRTYETSYACPWESLFTVFMYGEIVNFTVVPYDAFGHAQLENARRNILLTKAPHLNEPDTLYFKGDSLVVTWTDATKERTDGPLYNAVCGLDLEDECYDDTCADSTLCYPVVINMHKVLEWTPDTSWIIPLDMGTFFCKDTLYFMVRKKDSLDHISCWSNIEKYVVKNCGPDPVDSLWAVSLPAGTVEVCWESPDSIDVFDRYLLVKTIGPCFSATDWDTVAEIVDQNTHCWNDLPSKDSVYCYCIAIIDKAGNESERVCVEAISDRTPPDSPVIDQEACWKENVSQKKWWDSGETNTICWNRNDFDPEDSFQIMWCSHTIWNACKENVSLWTTDSPYTVPDQPDQNLLGEQIYYYRIRAKDWVGNVGKWSEVASCHQDQTPPYPVENMWITLINNGFDVIPQLNWIGVRDSDGSSGMTGGSFTIYRDGNSVFTFNEDVVDSGFYVWRDDSIQDSYCQHEYSISPADLAGVEQVALNDTSNVLCAQPDVEICSRFNVACGTLYVRGDDYVTLCWPRIENIDMYRIERSSYNTIKDFFPDEVEDITCDRGVMCFYDYFEPSDPYSTFRVRGIDSDSNHTELSEVIKMTYDRGIPPPFNDTPQIVETCGEGLIVSFIEISDYFPPNPSMRWGDTTGVGSGIRFFHVEIRIDPNTTWIPKESLPNITGGSGHACNYDSVGIPRVATVRFDPGEVWQGDIVSCRIVAEDSVGNKKMSPSASITLTCEFSSFILALRKGWNLVSVPIRVSQDDWSEILGDNAAVWIYSCGGYREESQIVPGEGYFIYSDNGNYHDIDGPPIQSYRKDLCRGWNLIGSVDEPISIYSIKDENTGDFPDYIDSDAIYEYNNQFLTVNQLLPGKGYWVFAITEGTIIVSSNSVPVKMRTMPRCQPIWTGTLSLSDGQCSRNLSFGIAEAASEEYDIGLDLALPPEIDSENSSTFSFIGTGDLQLVKDIHPIHSRVWLATLECINRTTISCDIAHIPEDASVYLETYGKRYNLRMDPHVTFDPGRYELRMSVEPVIPTSYNLDQNYPNPFNATTTIAYSLPEESSVKIIITNLLGQRMRAVVDEVQPAGRYRIRWDGKDGYDEEVSSGIYFVQLQAGNYIATRKMVLLK